MLKVAKSNLFKETISLDDISINRIGVIQKIHNLKDYELAQLCNINSTDYEFMINNDPVWILDKICQALNLSSMVILEASGADLLKYYIASDKEVGLLQDELMLLNFYRNLPDDKKSAILKLIK